MSDRIIVSKDLLESSIEAYEKGLHYTCRSLVGEAIANSQPAEGREPVYQIGLGVGLSFGWHEVSEKSFKEASEMYRKRILYTAPADTEQPSPKKIADAILQEYAVLAHDGDKLNGEHYWVGANELVPVIRPYLASMDTEQPSEAERRNIKLKINSRRNLEPMPIEDEAEQEQTVQDREDAERWQYLVKAISNRAEWEAVDEIFEAARIEQWEKAVLDDEIDKVRQQEQG